MSYMQDFLFTPAQARTPVKVLSGGERARLALALINRRFAEAMDEVKSMAEKAGR